MHHGKSLPILLRPPPTSTCINERARTHTPSPTLPEREREEKKNQRPVCFTTLAADAAVEGDLCTTAVREAGCSCRSNFFSPPVDLRDPARFEIQSLCLRLNSIYVHRFPLLTSLFKRVVCHVILPPIFMLLWDAARLVRSFLACDGPRVCRALATVSVDGG